MWCKLKSLLVCVLLLAIVLQQVYCDYNPHDYNLDLKKFEYFKYPPYRGNQRPVQDASVAEKAIAVVKYFHNLLAGHPIQQRKYYVPFDPNRGLQMRDAYQRQFGYRGENLIALVGNGYSPKALRYYGAIGKHFGKY
ncbi:uncharacterized protein LOC118467120 [Anopheles albimanus]|uniref:uncharacterized protein LOC118467120 n=1 Tax=Anopheles albimanus TaxID=7167 RepID=UPI0016419AED|nr:uncharacterized protein LOC118467120 [Anopheles albimanus]